MNYWQKNESPFLNYLRNKDKSPSERYNQILEKRRILAQESYERLQNRKKEEQFFDQMAKEFSKKLEHEISKIFININK